MAELNDLTGRRFGRLVAVGPHFSRKRRTIWPCHCDCGATRDVTANNLKNGNTKSCGCYRREFTTDRNTTHGLGKPPEYVVWVQMRERCYNPKSKAFGDYGARGITVCERWRESFANFYTDMGSRPTPDHQLDRKNNMAGYSPENCRWVTRIENCSNRRDNVYVEWRGESLTVYEWSRRTGIKTHTLWQRLNKLHWDVERAMTAPVRQMRRKPKTAQAA